MTKQIRPGYYQARVNRGYVDIVFEGDKMGEEAIGEVDGSPGAIVECQGIIEALDLNFNLGSMLKYLWRCGKEEGEDRLTELRKVLTYAQFEIDRLEASNEQAKEQTHQEVKEALEAAVDGGEGEDDVEPETPYQVSLGGGWPTFRDPLGNRFFIIPCIGVGTSDNLDEVTKIAQNILDRTPHEDPVPLVIDSLKAGLKAAGFDGWRVTPQATVAFQEDGDA